MVPNTSFDPSVDPEILLDVTACATDLKPESEEPKKISEYSHNESPKQYSPLNPEQVDRNQ